MTGTCRKQSEHQPKLHAKDVSFEEPEIGFSICGIYSFHLVADPKLATCKNCLKRLAPKAQK